MDTEAQGTEAQGQRYRATEARGQWYRGTQAQGDRDTGDTEAQGDRAACILRKGILMSSWEEVAFTGF